MLVTFKQGAVSYRLLVLPEGRREQEAKQAAAIKADPAILKSPKYNALKNEKRPL